VGDKHIIYSKGLNFTLLKLTGAYLKLNLKYAFTMEQKKNNEKQSTEQSKAEKRAFNKMALLNEAIREMNKSEEEE